MNANYPRKILFTHSNRESFSSIIASPTRPLITVNSPKSINPEMLHRKVLLLEEENRILSTINNNLNPSSSNLQLDKFKALEHKVSNLQTENIFLVKQLSQKKNEIEELYKKNDEFVNKEKEFSLKIIEISKKIEIIENEKFENEKQNFMEKEKIILEKNSIEEQLKNQILKVQDIEKFYSDKLLICKDEIFSIKNQFEERINDFDSKLTEEKQKFSNINFEKTELIDQIQKLQKNQYELEKELINERKNNEKITEKIKENTELEEKQNKRDNSMRKVVNIEDIGEKISNLLHENEKLADQVMFLRKESQKWRDKYVLISEKEKKNEKFLTEPTEEGLKERNINFSGRKTGFFDKKKEKTVLNSTKIIAGKVVSKENNCKNGKIERISYTLRKFV